MGKEELFGGRGGGEKEILERVFLADFNWGREDDVREKRGREGRGTDRRQFGPRTDRQ